MNHIVMSRFVLLNWQKRLDKKSNIYYNMDVVPYNSPTLGNVFPKTDILGKLFSRKEKVEMSFKRY